MRYHSDNEYVKDALLVRASDGQSRIAWVTENVPLVTGDSSVTFAWMAGLSGSKGVHQFDLYVDGTKALTFLSQADSSRKVLQFNGVNGARLTFVVTRVDQFEDLFGYMFLRLPVSMVSTGKPLKLAVQGTADGSVAWYMTFEHQLKPYVRMEALPLLVAGGDSTQQLIKIGIEHYGPPGEIRVAAKNGDSLSCMAGWGLTTVMLRIPSASHPLKEQITVGIGSTGTVVDTVDVKPVHRRIFYLLPHSHTDIGYSDYQAIVEHNHMKYIDEGIRLGEKTEAYPAGARFRWNIEVLWPLETYLRHADIQKRNVFVEAVRKGYIGLNALYANELTGLCRPEELLHTTEYARSLEREYGFAINTAMISDIPSYTSSIVTALSLAGIKYLSSGPNYLPATADLGDRIGYALRTWGDKPFYWASQSGQHKILFWMAGRGYSWFHGLNMGRLRDASVTTLCEYLDELDTKDYPYDMVQVRYTMGDNAGPDSDLSDCVEAWNKEYVSPKMVIATAQEMFETFEKHYGKNLPVYTGDFTPYWEDGAVSTAREVAWNRAVSEKLVQAAALDAMVKPSVYDPSAFSSAWRNAVLFDEHTWGASNSISEPDSPNVVAQWKYKKSFVEAGMKEAHTLLLHGEQSLASSGRTNVIDVVNTNSWPRSDLVTIPGKYSRSTNTVKDAKGRLLPSQRLSDGDLAVLVYNVPPFGIEQLVLSPEKSKAPLPDLWVGNGTIDNGTVALRIDPTTGSIASLVWDHEEFVDTSQGRGLNQYFYVPGRDPSTALTDLLTDVRVKERGPLVASLLVESSPAGTNGFRREIRLVKGIDRVDIEDTIDKKKVREKEAVHLGFPFLVPGGVVRTDNGWEVVRPEVGQLPGSCKDYCSVQRWVDISNESRGITWTTTDAPLVEIGAMTSELPNDEGQRVWRQAISPTQRIYSYVMNNYWHTNYRADQEGKVTLRYALIPHHTYNGGDAAKAGIDQSQTLLVIPARARIRNVASLCSVDPSTVVVTSLKPSDDRKGFILRLYNPGDELVRATVRWNRARAKIYESSLREERGQQIQNDILLPKYGVATLRVEVEK